jgi:hypothetical protein
MAFLKKRKGKDVTYVLMRTPGEVNPDGSDTDTLYKVPRTANDRILQELDVLKAYYELKIPDVPPPKLQVSLPPLRRQWGMISDWVEGWDMTDPDDYSTLYRPWTIVFKPEPKPSLCGGSSKARKSMFADLRSRTTEWTIEAQEEYERRKKIYLQTSQEKQKERAKDKPWPLSGEFEKHIREMKDAVLNPMNWDEERMRWDMNYKGTKYRQSFKSSSKETKAYLAIGDVVNQDRSVLGWLTCLAGELQEDQSKAYPKGTHNPLIGNLYLGPDLFISNTPPDTTLKT